MSNEPKGWWHKEVEDLQQQLADSQKREMMLRGFVKLLRDYIPASAVGNMTVQEALAATADLENVRLCEKEPVARKISYGSLIFLEGYAKLPEETLLYRAWRPK